MCRFKTCSSLEAVHELWRLFENVIGNDLLTNCCGVLPNDVRDANRTEKMREISVSCYRGILKAEATLTLAAGFNSLGFKADLEGYAR